MKLLKEFIQSVLQENVSCRVCGNPTDGSADTCEEHKDEPTKLEVLPADISANPGQGLPVHKQPASVDGRPHVNGWRGF